MRLREQLTAVSLATALLITATAATTSAAGPKTRYVDGDGAASAGDCNGSGHAFSRIQDAVDASGRNDTVIVCPGTYEEQVRIRGNRDGLTLASSRPFGATIKTPPVLEGLYGASSFTTLVYIEATDGVTVRGFKTIARTSAPCTNLYISILATASRRTQIRGNRVLAPGSSTSRPCAQYFGIAAISGLEGSPLTPRRSSAVIAFNEVRDAVVTGVDVEGWEKQMRVDIVHDSIRAYYGQARTKPRALSTPVGISQAGVNVVGDVVGTLRHNVIQGAVSGAHGGPTFMYGIVLSGYGLARDTLTVQGNLIRRASTGLYAQMGSGYRVLRNHIRSAQVAVQLVDVAASRVASNRLGATFSGIAVQSSTDNAFAHNTVTGSGGTCSDDSTGTGTGGTGNLWAGNTASQGSMPAAICPVP